MVRRCWVNVQCRGVLLIWITVGQGPIVLAVGAGGGCLDIFSVIYLFSFLSPSLLETARCRLKGAERCGLAYVYSLPATLFSKGGGRVVRWPWVNFQCRASYSLDDSRARAYSACSRCGWGFIWTFLLSSSSLSLADDPI